MSYLVTNRRSWS